MRFLSFVHWFVISSYPFSFLCANLRTDGIDCEDEIWDEGGDFMLRDSQYIVGTIAFMVAVAVFTGGVGYVIAIITGLALMVLYAYFLIKKA